jgi:hypothetical protein
MNINVVKEIVEENYSLTLYAIYSTSWNTTNLMPPQLMCIHLSSTTEGKIIYSFMWNKHYIPRSLTNYVPKERNFWRSIMGIWVPRRYIVIPERNNSHEVTTLHLDKYPFSLVENEDPTFSEFIKVWLLLVSMILALLSSS